MICPLGWPAQPFFPLPGNVFAHLHGVPGFLLLGLSPVGLTFIHICHPSDSQWLVETSRPTFSRHLRMLHIMCLSGRIILNSLPPESRPKLTCEKEYPWPCFSAPLPGRVLSLDKAGSLGNSIILAPLHLLLLNSLCMAPSACFEICVQSPQGNLWGQLEISFRSSAWNGCVSSDPLFGFCLKYTELYW